jgi:Flp pilus assembly protein TadG
MPKRSEKGITLLFVGVALVFIVPMVGLGIDVGFLYNTKSKLQTAVDGAALAAARALNTGSSTASQALTAQHNAVNWFYANFPSNYFGTQNTVMSTSNVSVFDDPNNAHLRDVTVSATTQVNTLFMKWVGVNYVTVGASGNASRRDIVAMLVLDRSFSIQMAGECSTMIAAAKTFTGQFAEGRDNIGLVTFGGDVLMQQAPTTSFQSVLGYTNDQGSGTGLIDNINCQGNTNTATAISVAYNELWKMNLPGALNVLVLETDGLPNTLTLNFWDSTNTVAGLSNTSACTDKNGKTKSAGGFATAATFSTLQWTPQIPLGTTSYLSGNPTTTAAGLVGAVGTADPGDGAGNIFIWMQQPYYGSMMPAPGGSTSTYFQSTWATTAAGHAPGCGFADASAGPSSGGVNNYTTSAGDFAWFPLTDVFGNDLSPATNPYQTVTLTADSKHIANSGYTNYRAGAQNAADNAAYNARVGYALASPNTSTVLQASIFVIGLGGSGGSPPDPILMQRMANDPNGDEFNTTPQFSACSTETTAGATCVSYSTQPQGLLVYSNSPSEWSEGFLTISSQILRLSK